MSRLVGGRPRTCLGWPIYWYPEREERDVARPGDMWLKYELTGRWRWVLCLPWMDVPLRWQAGPFPEPEVTA